MIIERDNAIAILNKLAVNSATGHGQIALVRGEAGIGKTTLLQYFISQNNNRYQYYWGGCEALLTPRVLGPLHDMSSAFSLDVLKVLDSDASITKLLKLVLRELTSLSRPAVLIFEDAHWADKATLDFLKCLGRRITAVSALLIISYRQDETGLRHPLTNLLGEFPQSDTTRIDLEPLTHEGTQQMAGSASDNAAHLHTITKGNPFFITELLAVSDIGDEQVPASIQEAIAARLNRLTLEEQSFLEALSVIPSSIEQPLIRQLFPNNADDLLISCEEKHLLETDNNNNLRFRHELFRLSTKSRTSSLWQKNTHKKITEALILDSCDKHIEQITYHAYRARDAHLVLEYAPKAANIASQAGAHGEAATHLASALEFDSEASPELKASLYESWSYEAALIEIDDKVISARHRALAIWREMDRPAKVGENLHWLSRLYRYQGQTAKANQYADKAIRVLESTDDYSQQAMAYSLKSQLYMLDSHMEDAISWGNKALEFETKGNRNPEVRIHALNNVGTAMAFSDDLAGLDVLRESLRLALKHNFQEHAARAYTNMSDYAVGCRDFELAEKTINEGIEFDSNHDLDSWTYYLVGLHAQLRMKQGRLEEAETISQSVLKLEQLTLLMKLPALLVLARVQTRLGRPEAKDSLGKAMKDAISTSEAQYLLPARLSLVEAAWLSGQHEIANIHIDALLSDDISFTGNWRDCEFALWLHRYKIKNNIMPVDRLPAPYQMEIRGENKAAALAWESIGSPFPAALALLTAPASEDSVEHTKYAIKLLENMQATGALKRASEIAAESGFRYNAHLQRSGRKNQSRQHPLGLTVKEQEILPWVIKGLSNREISERFSRSERTIENHIASIFRKLNVHSRLEVLLRVKNEPWIISPNNSLQTDPKDNQKVT